MTPAASHLDEAEQRLEATLEAAREADMLHWEALCINLRSQLHAAGGEEESPRKALDAAIEISEKLESRLELVVRGGGDGLEKAREDFEACGAVVPGQDDRRHRSAPLRVDATFAIP